MTRRFESRPILIRRSLTATLQGTVVMELGDQVNHALHLFCIIAATVVARNVANQQVLDTVGPASFGSLYLTVALLTGVMLAAIGWLSRAENPRRITQVVHAVAAALMVLAALAPHGNRVVALITYVAMELSAAALILTFGLLFGCRFAPREARKMAARVGAGGILGGLAGGAILSVGASLLGSRWLFLVSAATLLVPLIWLSRLELSATARPPRQAPTPAEAKRLASYGTAVAITTILMVATTTLIDYQFRVSAKAWYGADELTAFFGFVVLTAGLVTILFQLLVLDRLLDRLGLFATAAIMPAGLFLCCALFGLLPGLATLVIFKLVDSGSNMSVQQATGGLLLAPLSSRSRSVWQSRIDGLAKRGGQAVAGLFLALYPWRPAVVLIVTLALSAIWLVALALTRGRYVRLLTEMLQDGGTSEPTIGAYDGGTVRLLEAELSSASPARAAIVLDLLARAGRRADDRALARLDAEIPHGSGALLVVNHLATFRDTKALTLFVRHRQPQIGTQALLVIADIDPDVAERLARQVLLEEGNTALAAIAAALLADNDEAALSRAQALVRATAPSTRLALAQGFARCAPGAPPAIGDILAQLACDEERPVARQALEALGRQPSSAGTEVALAALHRRDTRNAAMRALVGFGPAAVERICEELKMYLDEPRTAGALAWVLGRLGAGSALPSLAAALRAPHVEVRLSAAIALNSLHRRRSDLPLPKEEIESRYRPELTYFGRMRDGARLRLRDNVASRVLRLSFKQRAQASLECVFRMLALEYPEDSIRGALTAVSSGDRRQRQLALELLDTLVDAELRHAFAELQSDRDPPSDPAAFLRGIAALDDSFLAALARAVLVSMGERLPRSATAPEDLVVSESLVREILDLQAISIFGQASAEDLAELVSLLQTRAVPKGSVIFREGDPPDAMYIIRSGKVGMSARGQVVDQLGPGEAFGIVAVLDRKPCEGTATALTDCELRVLAADDLLQMLSERPLFMHSIFRALTQSIRSQIDRVALGRKADVA